MQRMGGHVLSLIVSVMLLGMSATAWARATDELNGPIQKASRGFANLISGWMEVPYRISANSNRRDPIASTCAGALRGVEWGVLRTGIGALELVTCWLPLPSRYRPILPPPRYWQWQRLDNWQQTYEQTLQ